MRYRRDKSAGVIVFHRGEDDCRFLLLLSRLTKRPLWEFPKGGVDEGETLHQAALRELQEETGIGASDIRMVEGFEHREEYRFTSGKGDTRTLVRKEVIYFLAEAGITDVRLSAHEASQFVWLPVDEALRKLKYKARREMLRKAAVASGCMSQGAEGEEEPANEPVRREGRKAGQKGAPAKDRRRRDGPGREGGRPDGPPSGAAAPQGTEVGAAPAGPPPGSEGAGAEAPAGEAPGARRTARRRSRGRRRR
jgi:bis(5'-nucleosidyl)-tetraphosphatase